MSCQKVICCYADDNHCNDDTDNQSQGNFTGSFTGGVGVGVTTGAPGWSSGSFGSVPASISSMSLNTITV